MANDETAPEIHSGAIAMDRIVDIYAFSYESQTAPTGCTDATPHTMMQGVASTAMVVTTTPGSIGESALAILYSGLGM